jgi:hypothetical protein
VAKQDGKISRLQNSMDKGLVEVQQVTPIFGSDPSQ